MPLLKRPLFGKKTRKSLEGPSTEGGGAAAEAEAEQSGGMPPPTPMWGNKAKAAEAPASAAEPAGSASSADSSGDMPPLPPGLKPMWSNKPKSSDSASSTSPRSDGALPLPPGLKPMWSNKPKSSASACSSDDAASSGLGRVAAGLSAGTHPDPLQRGPSASSVTDEVSFASGSISDSRLTSSRDNRETMMDDTGDGKKYCRQYELGKTLGKGSYAKVKLCTDVETNQKYAIKIFNISLLKRRRMWDSRVSSFKTAFDDVLHEIAIMRKMSHPNVMALKDVIDDATVNKLYMVMDYCPHGAIMDSHQMPVEPIPHDKCRKWFTDAVIGLDYLHFQDIIHFDLKPDNILIAEDGRAILADFGVSRMMNDQKQNERASTMTKGAPGTPTYNAPEVWGASTYEAKLADVWSLGVTLHAMVFGTLPYFYADQQRLIEEVTDEKEWECDPALLAKAKDAGSPVPAEILSLLGSIIRKRPEERFDLSKVKGHSWVVQEMRSFTRMSTGDWKLIEVSDEELRKAVISGHIENFRRTTDGMLHKTTTRAEADVYKHLGETDVKKFIPLLKSVKESTGRRVIMELQDLTHCVEDACLMDVKMGARTFTEEDAEITDLRADLLQKMQKIDRSAPTAEELAAGGVTKSRYLYFRDSTTTTTEMGFRVDGCQLADGLDAQVPDTSELRTITELDEVLSAVSSYVQRRKALADSFIKQLVELRGLLEVCDVFMERSFIRTSLLFVYSSATNETQLAMIDFPKVTKRKTRLTHRDAWTPGNCEDGYLTGLDNLIKLFERVRDEGCDD